MAVLLNMNKKTTGKIIRFKKILCLFDYKCNTGYGNVTKNIVSQLRRAYGNKLIMHICAINYFGDEFNEDPCTLVFSAQKSNAEKPDLFGRYGFLKILSENDYDGIFIIQDPGIVTGGFVDLLKTIKAEKIKANRKSFKSFYYFPVDTVLIPEIVKGMDFFDVIATYTEYGREEVCRLLPHLKSKLKVIPHGNNNNEFFFEDNAMERARFRKEYFMIDEEVDPRFVITNVNRNQPRKDIPATIFSFLRAKKIWPSELPRPFLYLHMHPEDRMGNTKCHNLHILLKQMDLVEGEDYMFPPTHVQNYETSVEKLRMIYHASDVFLTTTRGEGWGLSITEAMACRLPVIAPLHTSINEISGGGDRLFGLIDFNPVCNQMDNMIRYQCSIDDVIGSLLEVAKLWYSYSEDLEDIKNRAQKYVQSLNWDIIGQRFVDYFEQAFAINKCIPYDIMPENEA